MQSMLAYDSGYFAEFVVIVELDFQPFRFFMSRYLIITVRHFNFYLLSNCYKCNVFFNIKELFLPINPHLHSQKHKE